MAKKMKAKKVGRPPGKTQPIFLQIRTTPEFVNLIDMWAKPRKMSRSDAVRHLIELGVEASRQKGKVS